MRRTEGSRLLLAHPRARIMALCKVPKGTVARWCSGVRIPEEAHRVLLVEAGIPLSAWPQPEAPRPNRRCTRCSRLFHANWRKHTRRHCALCRADKFPTPDAQPVILRPDA